MDVAVQHHDLARVGQQRRAPPHRPGPKVRPGCAAAGDSASNQRDSGTSSGGGPRRGACRRAATAHRMRLASSSSPAATIAASVRGPVARSSRSARSSCARTRAAPSPSHHAISRPPRRSSSSRAIFSMAGWPRCRTGSRRLDGVVIAVAVRDEIPAGEPDVGRQSPPLPPSTMTVSFSGSSSRTTSRDGRSGHTKSASSGCIRPWKRSTWERPQ